MSRRRLPEQSDSLEMLLDTMCNTFGGIILIALMISLIAKDAKPAPELTDAEVVAKEMQERKLQQAKEELKQAQMFNQKLAAQLGDPGRTEQIKLLERREDVADSFEETKKELQEAQQKLVETAKSIEEMEQMKKDRSAENVMMTKQREEEKKRSQDLAAELNDVQKRLTREMNNRVRRLRLPREHETTKEPVEMIVRYGRIYPVQRYIRGASSGFNSGAIKLTSVGDELRELAPIPDKGIDPSNNIRAMVDYYKQLPRNSYLVFRVYGDSFGQFNISKEAASRMGKELSWVPLEDDARIMMGFGSGAPPPPPL
ncbi:MAG: hypothetical protein ACKVJX_11395 [Verrucomicrobiia bacterium]